MRSTLARLGAQGERLSNTEKNLDLAANQNKIAEEKSRELKTLNRSMFAVHVANPFNSSKRQAKRDQDVLDRHRQEREIREETRANGYSANRRMEESFQALDNSARAPLGMGRSSAAERSKFKFEDDDSEDERMENQIDDGLDTLAPLVNELKKGAYMMGDEVDSQNKYIDRIAAKVSVQCLVTKYRSGLLTYLYRAMLLMMVSG
jgi:hypothetical protein